MDLVIIQNSVTSFMIICVIIVFALIFMRSRFFSEVYDGKPTLFTHVLLIIFFGLLSVFGSSTGLQIYGAAVNVRDLGPMAAGLVCGPYIGIGSGIIGGLFRFAQGGPYMWTGLSAPILSGILGGILFLANRREFVSTGIATLYIGLSETLISCYTLILVTSPAQLYTVVTSVAIPMIFFNIVGMFIFASTVHYTLKDRRLQKELQKLELEVESQRNLATIINTIPFPVYVLDRSHRFRVINDSLCQFIGYSQEKILGNTPRDFFNERDSAFHWDMTEEVFRSKNVRTDEVKITRPDGQPCTLISTSAYYTDAADQEFMVGVIQDISDRTRMEAAIAENEAWYRTLFEHTGAATIIVEEDVIISQANSEFAQLTGYSRDEIEGKLSWMDIGHREDMDRILDYHRRRRVDPGSAPTSYTTRIIDRAGSVKTLHATVAMIPGTKRSIASFVDISDRKRNEETLVQINRKLNLLSSITRHDIINQLLILKGFHALLKKNTTDPTLLDYISRSEKATGSIERQIIFTRDYQDMGVKAPVWQNVRKSVLNAKGALPTGGVTITVDRPNLEILADPLFEKVFYNLIDNSLQYGGPGLRNIRINSREDGDEKLLVTYEDDGVGIAADVREHLFERGFGKHTGFGLFLSREILSITGITIQEDGDPGKGARFAIRVPKGVYRFSEPGTE